MKAIIRLTFEYNPARTDPEVLTGELLQFLLLRFPEVYWQCSDYYIETPNEEGQSNDSDKL